jgi:hypothetical protein
MPERALNSARSLLNRCTDGGTHLAGNPATEVRAELREGHADHLFLGGIGLAEETPLQIADHPTNDLRGFVLKKN